MPLDSRLRGNDLSYGTCWIAAPAPLCVEERAKALRWLLESDRGYAMLAMRIEAVNGLEHGHRIEADVITARYLLPSRATSPVRRMAAVVGQVR